MQHQSKNSRCFLDEINSCTQVKQVTAATGGTIADGSAVIVNANGQ